MAINRIVFDNRDQQVATWSELRALFTELKLGRGHALFLEESGGFEMNVTFIPEFGFYVSALSAAARERVASDRSLPSDRIKVVIADEQEVPRSILIGEELAESIIREFFETGKISSAADWLDPFEVTK